MTAAVREPRVCIGVPVYNGERYLEETLRCLLDQSYGDIEILISDNASSDGTADICRRIASADPRVHYFRNATNLGSTGNLRRLGALARGTYFKIANADDLCATDLVASCVEVLDLDPEVVLSCGQMRLIDADGRDVRPYEDDMHLRSPDPVERFRGVIGRVRMTGAFQGVMRTRLARVLLPRYGGYNGGDMVVLAAAAIHGQVHQIPRVLFFRRIHAASATAKTDHAEMQAYLDPARTHTLPAYLTRMHLGYLREIGRAPVSWAIKQRLALAVARSLASQRNDWGRELVGAARSALAGRHD